MIGAVLVALTCLVPPTAADVVRPYDPPACAYCPGHRGITFGTVEGSSVTASAAGEVTFAGQVAGVLWVVVAHADGRRTSFGHLQDLAVTSGQRVISGQRLGAASARLVFTVRDGDVYLDPATLLAAVRRRPMLVPMDGTPPRRPPPPTIRCPETVAPG